MGVRRQFSLSLLAVASKCQVDVGKAWFRQADKSKRAIPSCTRGHDKVLCTVYVYI